MTLHMVTDIHVHVCNRKSSWDPNPKHTGTWSAAVWPPPGKCYRPAVFFHHLSLLTALSLPQRKIRRALRTCYYLNIFTLKKTRVAWNCAEIACRQGLWTAINFRVRRFCSVNGVGGGSQGRGAHRLPSVTACCLLLPSRGRKGSIDLGRHPKRGNTLSRAQPHTRHGTGTTALRAAHSYVTHTHYPTG